MIKIYASLALSMTLLGSLPSIAQESFGGHPAGLRADLKVPAAPLVVMPFVDAQAMIAEDDARAASGVKGPYRFGFNHAVQLGLANSGIWHEFPNGDRMWRVAIECPEAYSINFEFHDYLIPPGAQVFVYSETEQIGAFTMASSGNQRSMGVTQLSGDRITIEYNEPAAVRGQGRLLVGQVTHAYRDILGFAKDIGDSGACNNNVICPVGDPWRDQIRSVAIITAGGNGLCTGQLLNNCSEDGTPYFLTAAHCLGGSVNNWVYRFNWNSPSCSQNQNGPTNQTLSGSVLLASSAGSDVALIRINTAPPSAYNVYYSGWDRSTTAPTSSVSIHHPRGDLKKISFDNQAATQATFGGAQCWRIATWEDGTTEPGSSGSGLWNQNGHLIGQLYGGQASCSNNVNDYFGRFNISWPTLTTHLGTCGPVLNGYDPNNSSPLANDAGIQSITGVPAELCNVNTINPTVTIRNNGTNTLTSLTITYQVTGSGPATANWSGSLVTGAQANYALPTITVPNGAVTLTVVASQPNGQLDENAANNTRTSDIQVASPASLVTLSITLDDYGSETTWRVTTTGGTVVRSGGPYADGADQTLETEALCLAEGCYVLTFFDDANDGLCCNYGNGNFQVIGPTGDILVNNSGTFGSTVAEPFCVGAVGLDDLDRTLELSVAPNPTDGLLSVWLPTSLDGKAELIVRDALGRVVDQQQLSRGLDRIVVDLRAQPAGLYFVELVSGRTRGVERVVLTR